jgi:ribonuclease BN (tRNA processing enzyme)
MEITVLGCGAAYPRPGGACTGFLVDEGDTTVWLDAGNGTFSRLQLITDFRTLDAVVISHGHPDHTSDILPLMYGLGFDPATPATRVDMFAPPDVVPAIKRALGAKSKEIFDAVFDVHGVDEPFKAGSLRFDAFRTLHPVETYGFRVEGNGTTLAYTSDSAWTDELVGPCRGADLLIAEATYVGEARAERGIHMWARESGRLASEAGVKRLVLTHIWPTFDPDEAVAEASETYDGPVEAAVEGARYVLS